MLADNAVPSSLPLRVWGGTYGDPSWGDPVQYDELCIAITDGAEVRIICYNRALGLIFASTPALLAIHRAVVKLTRDAT